MKKILKRKKLIITLAIIVILLVGLVIYGKSKLTQMAQESNVIELQEIQKRDLSDFISLTGSVSGENRMTYSSSATAEIVTMNVSVGDMVHEGDVIAVLDTKAIQSQIDMMEKSISNAAALEKNQQQMNQRALDQAKTDQKSQLSAANQAITNAQAQHEKLKNTAEQLNRQIETLAGQVASAQDDQEKEALEEQMKELKNQILETNSAVDEAARAVTEAKNNYNSIKTATDETIFSAQNTIDMQKYSSSDNADGKAQLEELHRQLEECTIKSSMSGIVVAVNGAAGDMNTPNAPLVIVESDQDLIMSASVGEKDILKLQEGMKAAVTSNALDDQEIKGQVIKVVRVFGGAAADVASTGISNSSGASAGGYSVQIKLEHCDLLSGMTAKAKITLSDKADILSVPYDLVNEDENGKSYVLCAEPQNDGKYLAVRKNVNLGEEIGYYVEVKDGEVKPGDYIIMDYAIQEGDVFEGSISEMTDDNVADTLE